MVSIIEEWWLRLLLGLLGSGIISYAAYQLRSLSRTGMVSAIILGTGFVVLGTPLWFAVLIVFFVSSSLWSKWKRSSKRKQSAESLYEKGGQRDAGQVWANGGVGLLLCALYALTKQDMVIYVYLGVMAAVTADTWATEIGSMSKQAPRSIITLAKVQAGTSGGVTVLGLIASLSGGVLIGLTAFLLDETLIHGVWIASAAGLIGSLTDSYIGARWQAMYRCKVCGQQTERQRHCDQAAISINGVNWLNNDAVNIISSIIAGVVAVLLSLLIL